MDRVIAGKIIWKRSKGKPDKNYFQLAGGSSYRRFTVTMQGYSKCMKQIQGKSFLVRVSEGSSYRESITVIGFFLWLS